MKLTAAEDHFLEFWVLTQIEFDIPVWLTWCNIFLYHISYALSGFSEFCTNCKFKHHNYIGCKARMSFVFGSDRNCSISIQGSWSPGTEPVMITATEAFHNSTKLSKTFLLFTLDNFKVLESFYSRKLFQWDVIRSKLVHLFV